MQQLHRVILWRKFESLKEICFIALRYIVKDMLTLNFGRGRGDHRDVPDAKLLFQ